VALLLPLSAAPAVAAPREISGVSGDCVGDTLSGLVQLRSFPAGGQVVLTLEQQTTGWSSTGQQVLLTVVPGQSSYPYAFSVAGFRTAKGWRVTATDVVTLRSVTSQRVDSGSCAPPTQLPEAPHPLLLPLSLLLSGGVALAWRRFAQR
jgi:hypothetical protein